MDLCDRGGSLTDALIDIPLNGSFDQLLLQVAIHWVLTELPDIGILDCIVDNNNDRAILCVVLLHV